jgi:hypothetical protein
MSNKEYTMSKTALYFSLLGASHLGLVIGALGLSAAHSLTAPDAIVDFEEDFKQKAQLDALTDKDVSTALCSEMDALVNAFNQDYMPEGKTLVIPQNIKAACLMPK